MGTFHPFRTLQSLSFRGADHQQDLVAGAGVAQPEPGLTPPLVPAKPNSLQEGPVPLGMGEERGPPCVQGLNSALPFPLLGTALGHPTLFSVWLVFCLSA